VVSAFGRTRLKPDTTKGFGSIRLRADRLKPDTTKGFGSVRLQADPARGLAPKAASES